MYDLAMSREIVRSALGKLSKAERLLKDKIPSENKGKGEVFIEKGSEELFRAACKVFEANELFYNFCKEKANTDFLENLTL